MSKNKQILIFSGIGLAVLGGVTALLLLTAPEKPAEEPEQVVEETDERLVISSKTAADIASVHIKNLSDEYDFVPNGDEWTVKGLETANVTTSAVKSMVDSVAAMTASQLVEENAADLSKYGLTAPNAEITVNFSDGARTFLIGNEVPADTKTVYFTESGKGTVYTFKKSVLEDFYADRFSFVDVTAMPEYDQSSGEMVEKFTIERVDLEEPIIIKALPAPEEGEVAVFSYELTSPYDANVDLTNAPNFIYSLFGLTADKAVWYGMEDKDYEIAGLNDPNCVFTLETNLKTYTITLGNAVAEEVADENGNVSTEVAGFYGMSSEVPDTLFLFSAENIPATTIQADAIISQLFLMPYIYSLESVEYSDCKGSEFTLGFESTVNGEETIRKHFRNGEEYDEQQIKNMYQFLIAANGDELYTEEGGNGELLATVTYTYIDKTQGENGQDVVKFYESKDDRKIIINVNGENTFKTKQIYINQLYSNAQNFLNGEEIVLTY